MPIFENNGKKYDIPEEKISGFIQKNPNAIANYEVDGRKYAIPANKLGGFIERYPNAIQNKIDDNKEQSDEKSQYGTNSASVNAESTFKDFQGNDIRKVGGEGDLGLRALQDEYENFIHSNREFMDNYRAKQKDLSPEHGIIGGSNPFTSLFKTNKQKQDEDRYNEIIRKDNELKEAIATHPETLGMRGLMLEVLEESMGETKSMLDDVNSKIRERSRQRIGSSGYADLGRMVQEGQKHDPDRMERSFLEDAEKMYDYARKILKAPSKYDASNPFVNFVKGAGDSFNNRDFWTAGLTEISRNLKMKDIAGKLADNEEGKPVEDILSPGELKMLEAFQFLGAVSAERAEDLSMGYSAAQSSVESLKFMAEFLLTRGASSAASSAAKKAVTKWLIKNTARNGIARNLGKGLVWGTDAALGTLSRTPLMPSTYSNITDRMVGYDEEGMPVEKDVASAFLDGFLDSLIENVSEVSSPHAKGILGIAGKQAGKLVPKGFREGFEKALQSLGKGKLGNLKRAVFNPNVRKFLKEAGYNGIGEEMLEEWYGNALRSVINDPDALKNFATWENQLTTFFSFLPVALTGASVSAATNLRAENRYKNSVAALESVLGSLGMNESEAKRFMDNLDGEGTEGGHADMINLMSELAENNDEKGKELFSAMSDYLYSRSKYKVLNDGWQEQMQEKKAAEDARLQEETGGYVNETTGQVDAVVSPDGTTGFITGETGEGEHKVYVVNIGGEKIPVSQKDFNQEDGWQIVSSQDKDSFVEQEVMRSEAEAFSKFSYNGIPVQVLENSRQDDGTVIVEDASGETMRVPENELKAEMQDEAIPEGTMETDEVGEVVQPEGIEQQESEGQLEEQVQVPMTEDGKPDYDSMTPEMFADEFEKEFGADAARSELEQMSADIDAQVEKLQKKNLTNRNERAENMREIARLKGEQENVRKALERYAVQEEVQENPVFSSDEEATQWVIENSEDLDEVLGTYDAVKGLQRSAALPRWQQELQGININPESFYRHGDRNLATTALRRGWLSKDGRSIDEVAHDLSNYGVEVSPQDIVDFMLENPSGKVRENSSELDALGQRFSELATKAAGVRIGKPDSPTGRLFIENMRTSNNMEQLREQINDAKRAEEEVLRSMAEQRELERESETEERAGRTLTEEEAESILEQMQKNAEVAPELELTPENWLSEFGEDGKVDTPIGEVKMGENQYLKLAQQGRNGKLGMIKPTLTNPDVIIVDVSKSKDGNTERSSSYVFVKSFVNESGERNYLFTSVTIKKGGNEVVVSNQEKKPERIKRLLEEGKLTYIKEATLPSESSTSTQGDQLTEPTGTSSEVKDTEDFSEKQENLPDDEIEKLYDEADSLEDSWRERIQDYIYEHYPTQATISAETRSPKGIAERDAMRNDEELKMMKEHAKAEIDAAIKKADAAFNKAMESGSTLFQEGESDRILFREVNDNSVSSFAQKHGFDEKDVKKYADSMRIGSLGGASYAFQNIKRKVRLDHIDKSLGEFIKIFAPIQNELYEKFGSIDELREEYVQKEMERRNVMEAARKRAEEEAEAERKRLEEFEVMSDEQLDSEYFKAIENNDENRIRDLVNEAARRNEYVSSDEFRMAHRAPSYDEEGIDKSMVDIANNRDRIRESLDEQLRMNRDRNRDESAKAIEKALSAIDRGEKPTVTIYRAVSKSLKEGKVRNGDWVTLSKSYAEQHGNHALGGNFHIMAEEVPAENLYWDGNDINEWGYDDKSDYRYRNTKNNRKLNDLITRDDHGDIIPLSQRFNSRKSDPRYRFIGEKGAANLDKAEEATTRLDNLNVAREMEEAGKEAKAIKLATGWERGADGKWRYETGDAKLKDTITIDGNTFKRNEEDMLWTSGRLADVVDNDELFDAYPELADIRLETDEMTGEMPSNGEYNPKTRTIRIHASELKYLNSLLNHEIQHAIQDIEGFSRGTSTEDWDAYRHASGEVEARNVQSRLNMTTEERRNSLASETEDVAREDQLFLNDALGVSASIDYPIEEVNKRFNEELDKLTEENADRVVLSLGKPNDVLRSAGVSDKPMKLYGNKVIKKMKKHGFALSELRGLPGAVANPIAVFDNIGRDGNRSILTELRTEQGNFLVTIDLGKGKEDIDFNIVSSVFGKSDNKVADWIDKGYATYINKEKALDYLHHSAPIAEALSNSRLDSVANVIENFENPTILEGEISSAIDELSDELGVKVNKVKSRKDLPEGIQRKMRGGRYPGLFDPKTGEVYMVMDEITDAEDAQATMLHEVVGHKGVRGLFGERIGEFAQRVLASMPESERAEWLNKYDGDGQLAAEEYVARFAEGYENPTMWEKIKAIIRDLLRDLGIDLRLSDNDLKYVLWKGVNGMKQDGTFMKAAEYATKDREMQRVLFREVEEDEEFSNRHLNLGERVQEAFQDRMISVKNLLDEVKRRGGKVTDYANPYVAENLATSKSKAQIEDFNKRLWDPLMEHVKEFTDKGKTRSEIDRYMMAKHAPERNALLFEREGVENGSGMTNEEAKEIVEKFEKDFDEENIKKFWESVRNATRFTTETWQKHGLIDRATKDYYDSMYEYYVPLRGWEESEADAIEYIDKSRGGGTVSVNKKAKGRKSIADSPLAYIANMAHSAIVTGNKNDIKRNVFEMMALNKNPDLYHLKKVYQVNTGTEESPIWVEQLEKPAAEFWNAGRVKMEVNRRNEAKRESYKTKQHQVEAFVNGQKYIMEFNGNMGVRVANAINGANVVHIELLQNSIGKLTRWMSSNFTSRNPEFVITNFMRDFGYAIPAYWMKGGNAGTLLKNMPKAFRAIHNDLAGNKVDSETQKMYDEFKMNGGLTGYVHMQDVDSYKKWIERDIRRMSNDKTFGDVVLRNKAMRAGANLLEYLAQMSENSTRFAVYMSERQAGKSATEAAYAAKEITTNFNRKGTYSGVLGSLFGFFNATIQGSANALGLAKRSPGKFAIYCGSLIAIQYLASAMCRMFGGDDEIGENNYDRLAEWVKYNNFILPDPKHAGRFITIPLPHFFRALSSMGVIAGEVMNGKKSTAEGIESLFNAVSGDLTPVEITTPQFKNMSSFLRGLIPTAAKPIMEAQAFNRNFMNLPISREAMGDQKKTLPQHQLAKKTTNPTLVSISKWLNETGGGGEYTTAEIEYDEETGEVDRNGWKTWMDVNPAKFEHVVEGIFGGRLKFFNNVYKTVDNALNQEFEASTTPIIRPLYQSPKGESAWIKFYEVRDDVTDIDAKTSEFMKLGKYDAYGMINYKNARFVKTYKSYEEVIKELSNALKKESNPGQAERIKKVRDDIVKDFALEVKRLENKDKKGKDE